MATLEFLSWEVPERSSGFIQDSYLCVMVKSTLQAAFQANKRNPTSKTASNEVTAHHNPFQQLITHTDHTTQASSSMPKVTQFAIDVKRPSKRPKIDTLFPFPMSSEAPQLPPKPCKQVNLYFTADGI
jgi:hypothetical protein